MARHKSLPPDRKLHSLAQAARILGIGVRSLQCLIAAGKIPVVRPTPRRVLVDQGDLNRYIEKCRG